MKAARKRAQAIARGRGREARVIIPLAFEVAARISARPLDAFRNDPTQLANALTELHAAIGADGIVVALAQGMEQAAGVGADAAALCANGPVAPSLEACRRLRETHGDDVALLAGLSGPRALARELGVDVAAAGDCFTALVKAFCAAGSDVVLVLDDAEDGAAADWQAAVKTADNIARFHQASLLGLDDGILPAPWRVPFDAPAADGLGFIVTARPLPHDTDIALLRQWVAAVRGA
ncbi:MAG: hypothetical protein RLW62_02030 [Gammaproteobacteria bacterium]